ncbi:MAG: hypothetical protein GKR90_22675 [Pseudomonadales bacterium]|nr:hypothetical protein [Pseudomonadales bacterium]
MNWDAIGAIGELISAVAVMITLVYLTLQVRQSNRLMQAQHRETNRNAVIQTYDPIVRDKQFADLIELSREGISALDSSDQRRVFEQTRNELLLAQSQFVRGSLMGDSRAAKIGVGLAHRAIATHPVARRLWDDVEWDGDFALAVNELLDANEPIQNQWRVYSGEIQEEHRF